MFCHLIMPIIYSVTSSKPIIPVFQYSNWGETRKRFVPMALLSEGCHIIEKKVYWSFSIFAEKLDSHNSEIMKTGFFVKNLKEEMNDYIYY